MVRDHAQNTTNPEISLVVYNVIPVWIGPTARAPITSIVIHMGEESGLVRSRYGEQTWTDYQAQGRLI